MTQEEKQLLFKDLCARLPYIVICKGINLDIDVTKDEYVYREVNGPLTKIEYNYCTLGLTKECELSTVRPFLRPMTSMTEEEILHIQTLVQNKNHELYSRIEECGATGTPDWKLYEISYIRTDEEIDYLNSRHLDWRGLIKKGLALEAPEGMYTVLCRNINAKTDIREKTPFFDKNGVRIYDGDVFVYLKYTNFEDGVPSDLIENYSKYENEVVLHPVFWCDKEKSWCSDVYGDCDYMASYNFDYVVVVTNRNEHPELYNY